MILDPCSYHFFQKLHAIYYKLLSHSGTKIRERRILKAYFAPQAQYHDSSFHAVKSDPNLLILFLHPTPPPSHAPITLA